MYTDINLLPYAVVSALPSESERRKWMLAFNKAYKRTNDANASIFSAWDAMKSSPGCRHIEGWFSTDKVDAQMDKIEQRQMNKSLQDFIIRGGVIVDTHSNRTVGAAYHIDLMSKGDDRLGNYGYAVIFHGTPYHDLVWDKILKGEIGGFSVGGFTLKTATECDGWACYRKILDQGVHETSVCTRPINDESVFTKVNALAKADIPEEGCACNKPVVGKDKIQNEEPAVEVAPSRELNKSDELLVNTKLKKAFSEAYRNERDPKVRRAFLKSYNILLANSKLSEKTQAIESIGCPRCIAVIEKARYEGGKGSSYVFTPRKTGFEDEVDKTAPKTAPTADVEDKTAAQKLIESNAAARGKKSTKTTQKGNPHRTVPQREARANEIAGGSKMRGGEVAGVNAHLDDIKTQERAQRVENTKRALEIRLAKEQAEREQKAKDARAGYPTSVGAQYKTGELEAEKQFDPIDAESEIEEEGYGGRTDLWHADPVTKEPIALAQTDAQTFPLLNSINRTFNMYATARLRGRKHFDFKEVDMGGVPVKLFLPHAYEKDTPEYRQGRKAFYESFVHPIYNKNGRLIDYVNQVVHTKFPQLPIEDKAKLRNVIMDKYYDKFIGMNQHPDSELPKFLAAHFNRIKKEDMRAFAGMLSKMYYGMNPNTGNTGVDEWLAGAVGGEPRLLKRALSDPGLAIKYLYLRQLMRDMRKF